MPSVEQTLECPVVALVFETSLFVSQEWANGRVSEYCLHILKRLSDAHGGNRLKIAFVSYANADTLPSPILCKRYFESWEVVSQALKGGLIRSIGVGSTNAGGSRGMASLDGLVAALEIFDILLLQSGTPRTFISHIIHFASAGPDASVHPSCNDTVAMDNVTWETLPNEFKKRNIQYSLISLRPPLTRYQELYNALTPEKPVNWFMVKPPHAVFLASFVPPKEPTEPQKRANESLPIAPADSKRVRTQPSESPKLPQKPIIPSSIQPAASTHLSPPFSSSSLSSHPPVVTPNLIQESSSNSFPNPVDQPVPVPKMAQYNTNILFTHMKTASRELQTMEQTIKTARQAGNEEEANRLMEQYTIKRENFKKIVATVHAYTQQQKATAAGRTAAQKTSQQPGAGSSGEASVQPPNQTTGPPPTQLVPPFSLNASGNSVSMGNIPSMQSTMGISATTARSVSDSSRIPPPPSDMNSMLPPLHMNQYQKLWEQNQRSHVGGGMSFANPSITNMGSGLRQGGPSQYPPMLPNAPTQLQKQQQRHAQSQTPEMKIEIWKGRIVWNGSGNNGTQEMSAQVTAWAASPTAARSSTWPKEMRFDPTAPVDLPSDEIQAWINSYGPPMVRFTSTAQSVQQVHDSSEYALQSLLATMTTKKVFATAAWTTPNGGRTSNMFIFPLYGTEIYGACFPVTGLPELPGKIPMPHPPKNPPKPLQTIVNPNQGLLPQQQRPDSAQDMQKAALSKAFAQMPQAMKDKIGALPPDQRALVLQQYLQRTESMLMTPQQQQTMYQMPFQNKYIQQNQIGNQNQMAHGSTSFVPGNNIGGPSNHGNPPFGHMSMPGGMSRIGSNTSMGSGGSGGMMQSPGGMGGNAVVGGMPTNMNMDMFNAPYIPRNDGGAAHGGSQQ